MMKLGKIWSLTAVLVLLLAAWVQRSEGPDEALSVDIDTLDTPDTGLSGSVRLYRQRFAHLELDLRFPQSLSEAAQDAITAYQMALLEPDLTEAESADLSAALPQAEENPDSAPFAMFESRTLNPGGAPNGMRGPPAPVAVFHLDVSRRFRGDNLHYIDHPAIGVLARVSVVERSDLRSPVID